MQDNLNPLSINLLKGGIVYSDFVTTVSPNYAKEVLTSFGGRGLEKTLSKYKSKFVGIINGIDYSYWNPEIDRYLPAHFSSREIPANKKDRNTFDKKGLSQKVLRQRLQLAELHKPIVGCIARLVPQKGIELIKHALQHPSSMEDNLCSLVRAPFPALATSFMS